MNGPKSSVFQNWLVIVAISFLAGGTITAVWMRGLNISVLFNSVKPFISNFTASAKMSTTPYSIAFVTVPNKEVGESIAGGLVSSKLAACVNIIPGVTSVYEWEGKIEKDSELILKIKTRTSRIPELTEYVKSKHPYDVCEVITTPIESGNQQYLDWLGKIVQEK